jgi:hypothetical protein
MNQTLEERVAALEKELAEMKSRPYLSSPLKKDPWATFGSARNDPRFDSATKLGEDFRRSQTWEKENGNFDGSGH